MRLFLIGAALALAGPAVAADIPLKTMQKAADAAFMKFLPMIEKGASDLHITTGTPPGVGSGMKPPQYLKAGDVMELTIEGLGTQRQVVHAWNAALIDD